MHLQRSFWRAVVSLALGAAATGASLPAAEATSCVQPELTTSRDRAGFVFTGRVVRLIENSATLRVEIAVDRVFKGVLPPKVLVMGGGMMGATLERGQSYLVFASQEQDATDLFAHLCGGTQPLSGAQEWVAQLGKGSAPSPGAQLAKGPIDDGTARRDELEPPLQPAPFASPPTAATAPTPPLADAAQSNTDPPNVPAAKPSSGCGACSSASHGAPGSEHALVWLAIGAGLMIRRRRS